MMKTNKGRWYIKQGERVQGPFPNKLIGSYLILGRITQDTLVSQDKNNWSPVSDYPAMVPEVVKEAGSTLGDRALMLARIREDERSSKLNEAGDFDNRREDEDQLMQLHRQIRDDVQQGYSVKSHARIVYSSIAILLLLTLIGFFISNGGESVKLADCDALPKPGINWAACNKQGEVLRNLNLQQVNFRSAKLQTADLSAAQLQGADLAYADLSQAILISARLMNSNLKGANLRRANLMGADLSGANLSYAELVGCNLQGSNLKQAIFDHAIWVNGEKCLPGSVGACLLPVSD
ncbi:MAG: pentapeptide repeat-containing protein [Gammaproteobacteria bacterium]|nr:pentapeptide repeat-containing protein [Gammaproteobacteria bacterium]